MANLFLRVCEQAMQILVCYFQISVLFSNINSQKGKIIFTRDLRELVCAYVCTMLKSELIFVTKESLVVFVKERYQTSCLFSQKKKCLSSSPPLDCRKKKERKCMILMPID